MRDKRKYEKKFNRLRFKEELRGSVENHFIDLTIEKEEIDNFDPDDFISDYYDDDDDYEESHYLENDNYMFENRLGMYEGWSDFEYD